MSKTGEHKTFSRPDEMRPFPNGQAQILDVQPGWRWSSHVKPMAKTHSGQAPHFQDHLSGRLGIKMDDGTELVAEPGDVTALPGGHDAGVIGDEPVVVIDGCGASNYGRG